MRHFKASCGALRCICGQLDYCRVLGDNNDTKVAMVTSILLFSRAIFFPVILRASERCGVAAKIQDSLLVITFYHLVLFG